jgi:type IV pilus assembly protein PilN
MATINLLPWREELRAERQRSFYSSLGLALALAVLFVVAGDRIVNLWLDEQRGRNDYLRNEINELDQQVAEIRGLRDQRTLLLERMQIIQELQGNRPIIVRVLDQLVRTVPDGVYYRSVIATGNTVSIQGIAESNNRVSSLMRQLDASDWLENPNLDAVRAADELGDQAMAFGLTVQIQLPDRSEEDI